MIPQLIITLSPAGDLQAELPYNGGRRIVALAKRHLEKEVEQAIKAIAKSPKEREIAERAAQAALAAIEGDILRETLSRILHSQLRGTIQCGEDGSPTQQQVTHWERHTEWPSDRCPMCRAEGRTLVSTQKRQNNWQSIGDGSCKVRRVAPQGKARKLTAKSTKTTAQDIGLSV